MLKNKTVQNFLLSFCCWFLLFPPEGLAAFTCPQQATIYPCTCTYPESGGDLICELPGVTQEVINKAFAATREANQVGPQDWLEIAVFRARNLAMSSLDLTPFHKTHFTNSIYVAENPLLTSLVVPPHLSLEMRTMYVILSQNSLTNLGILDFLNGLDPSPLRIIDLQQNLLDSVPDLSQFTEIHSLDLSENNIHGFIQTPSPFKLNSGLLFLKLDANDLGQIGDDAFVIDPPVPPFHQPLDLTLTNNNLDDSKISSMRALPSDRARGFRVDFGFNNFEFIGQEKFSTFLTSHYWNQLLMDDNNFFCDDRMRWLHDGRDLYVSKVFGVNCVNQPGYDIFNTTLFD